MIRGKAHIALLVAFILALALAGCGGGGATTNEATASNDSGSATSAATGETGATSGKKSKSGSKSKSSKNNAKTSDGKSSAPPKQNSAPRNVKDPSQLSEGDQTELRTAFNSITKAIQTGDVDYLCGEAYSKKFLSFLNTQGGCDAYTKKLIDNTSSYKATVTGSNTFPNTDIAAVYAKFNITNAGGHHQSRGALYFVQENGKWKRTVPPAPKQ